MDNKNLTACAYPCIQSNHSGIIDTVDPGFTKHEKGALMIASGLVAKYNLKSPEDQKTIAQLSYELSAEVLNMFK